MGGIGWLGGEGNYSSSESSLVNTASRFSQRTKIKLLIFVVHCALKSRNEGETLRRSLLFENILFTLGMSLA